MNSTTLFNTLNCRRVEAIAQLWKLQEEKMQSYPAIGKVFEARFGELAYHLDFNADGKQMTFTSVGTDKPVADAKVTVSYTAVFVRSDVFMVYWTEPDGSTVTHVEDFENETVHTNITLPDHQFLNFTGTFKPVPTH